MFSWERTFSSVASPHEGEERADGHLGGRYPDVDGAALHQVGVGAAVDQRRHATRAHALGQQRRHDVVLIVVGQRQEQVHLVDVFLVEQFLVGGIALQHQGVLDVLGQPFGVMLVAVDHLHLVVVFDGAHDAVADVAAAGDHDALDALVHAPQLAHHLADVLGRRQAEHFVAGLDQRVAFRRDRRVTAEDGSDARIDLRDVLAQVLERVADERPALEGAHRHQADQAVGELEHLQRLGKLDQLDDVFGDDLFRADRKVDSEVRFVEELGMLDIVGRAHARDACGQVEEGLGNAAGAQVGLVALRHGNQQVGILGAGLAQGRRAGGVARHGAQVEALLQQREPACVGVDDRDVVGLRHQAFGHRGADLAGTEDDDLHCSSPLRPSGMPSAFSLR